MKKSIVFVLAVFLLLSTLSGCEEAPVVTPENTTEEMTKDSPVTDSLVNSENTTEEIIKDSPITDFYYEERDNGITIIKYRGTDEHVVIPSTINNVPVTVINTIAFHDSINLKSVVIPENVTIIEETFFIFCKDLTNFIVAEGNKNFSSHDGVLYNKDKSQLVLFPIGKEGTYIIPDCVKSISEYAFYSCFNLTSITIPSGIESIGFRAFSNCPNLININVDKDNELYSSLNGVLYNKNQTQIITVPGGKTGTFEIPGSVADIGAYAFYGCISISNIKIPDSVTSIGEWAFSKCSNLKNITIPNGIKEIKRSLFDGCTGLTNIVIPDSVTIIDESVFFKCTSLSDIELPSGLLSIGTRAFFGCTGLRDIIIPENVATLGAVVFQDCLHVNIYVKQESQPAGWESNWNYLNFPVVWGYTGS